MKKGSGSDNRRSEADKPAPMNNVPAERIILGKVLSSPEVFWEISPIIQSFHFSVDIHEKIYSALRDISLGGLRPSLTLIQSRVGPEYGEDNNSTITLLTALIRNVDDVDDINEHMRLVIELWQRRRMMEIFNYGMSELKKSGTDMGYLMVDMENSIKDVSANSQTEPLLNMGEITKRVVHRSEKTQKTGKSSGYDTGLPSLDEILGKIHPGDFGFICARQGDAKTVLALQIANTAQLIAPSIVFSLEMQKEDLGTRALAGESSLSVSQINEGDYALFELEELRAAEAAFANSRCYVDDRAKLRIDQIHDRCLALKRSKGLGVVVIDHLRLVRATGRYNNKFDRIEYVTGEMKAMAKDLGIAVIALSQVTRNSQRRDDPAPMLTDTDGGASIEQDADWAIGMFRRDRWLKPQEPEFKVEKEWKEWKEKYDACKDKIEITTLKRRRGPDGLKRSFQFDGRRGLILELER